MSTKTDARPDLIRMVESALMDLRLAESVAEFPADHAVHAKTDVFLRRAAADQLAEAARACRIMQTLT